MTIHLKLPSKLWQELCRVHCFTPSEVRMIPTRAQDAEVSRFGCAPRGRWGAFSSRSRDMEPIPSRLRTLFVLTAFWET